jgi:hypothetical protein
MEPRKYHKIRTSRAKSEFWGYLKEKWKWEVPIFIIGTSANYNFNHINWRALYCEILGVLFFICVMFLWKSLRIVPERIYEEKQKDIELLEKENLSLKEQLRPKLEVTFDPSDHPWFQEQKNIGNPFSNLRALGNLYTYRIGLMNHGLEIVKNIKVRLKEIYPHPKNELPVVPCHLQFMNDTKQPFDESKDLQMTNDPKDGIFVDVFSYFHESKSDKKILGICHIVRPANIVVPTQPYKIKIVVSSDNGGVPINRRFRFTPRKNTKACMEMIN